MSRCRWMAIAALIGLMAVSREVAAQNSPYIGFAYPAGGQQGTTFRVRLGGQRLDGVYGAVVTGEGVEARLVEYRSKLNNQEFTLLRDQLKILKSGKSKDVKGKDGKTTKRGVERKLTPEEQKIVSRLQTRVDEYVNQPACAALASIVLLDVTMARNAEPGARELRLLTPAGASNPLVFHVGQVPEVTRKPLTTCPIQVLGKEQQALRKRPAEEAESRITLPCTMNGQIASGEVNSYRFTARKGQRLVVRVLARELIPYIADAVPGWFQPLLILRDADGNEVAFNDDYRFDPDPVLMYEVARSGEYVLTVADAIYRGREDFVYRITIGELPFITSIFPLGARVGEVPDAVDMKGWNLQQAHLSLPPRNAPPGTHLIAANRRDFVSNPIPFALDTLPECFEHEPNDDPAHAQVADVPGIVNGRIDQPGDWDVYRIPGPAGTMFVIDVGARRLNSPVDSLLKLTDEAGNVIAFNDDHSDPGLGLNTHHADSYLMCKFPVDGTYYVHIGDTARQGGEAYGYRLRLGFPRPDFELRATPSSIPRRGKSGNVTVFAIRKDGFSGPIELKLKDAPAGYSAAPVTIKANEEKAALSVKLGGAVPNDIAALTIEGRAKIGNREVSHVAVPAEDRMQAFLWRHLVPAEELVVCSWKPSGPPADVRPVPKSPARPSPPGNAKPKEGEPKFTRKQVEWRLKQLKRLYEEWLLTDDFYLKEVAKCEAAL